ncbi:MAG: hypothetical protein WD076_10510 [Parvularculaceae bacterium]
MRRLLYIFLFGLAAVSGAPYAAVLINWITGTSTATKIEADGAPSTVVIGPGAPIPAWLPVERVAVVVSASRWLSQNHFKDCGGVEVLTHSDLARLKEFYSKALLARGFAVEDNGVGDLNPATASYLGLAGSLLAERRDARLEVSITFRTPDGLLLRPRLVQIDWRELHPDQPSTFETMRARRAQAPAAPPS